MPGRRATPNSPRERDALTTGAQQSEPNLTRNGVPMPEEPTPTPAAPPGEEGKESTFTQADVDRIVRERVKREREKYADYDELRAKVEGSKSEAQRIADLEKRLADADAREQRAKLVQTVAGKYGIADPDDVALFLTGQDEDTLTAQAKRLADRDAARRKAGDIVPDAGRTPNTQTGDPDVLAFTRQLFDKE